MNLTLNVRQSLLALAAVVFASFTHAESVAIYQPFDGTTATPLEVFRECPDCPEMVVLPAGDFIFGAPLEESAFVYSLWNKPAPGEPIGWAHEGPEHRVTIDIPIAIGLNEVTRGEWMACVADGGCSHTPDPSILTMTGNIYASDPRHPVIDVSYLDMLEYVAWLNHKTGTNAYRLPTEVEWEYAARAGTQTKFAQGEHLSPEQFNIGVFEFQGDRYISDPANRKMPVTVDELDATNPWGLRHIAGNVIEQTMSCWTEQHLGLATSSAYLAYTQDLQNCRHVVKGGSFGRDAEYARPANRGLTREESRRISRGFRILREI